MVLYLPITHFMKTKSAAGALLKTPPMSGWNYSPQAFQGVNVLVVSQDEAAHRTLRGLFDHTRWVLDHASTLKDAWLRLAEAPSPVVLVDHHLPDGEWTDLVDAIAPTADCPRVIVITRKLDSDFYEAVLRRGGFDVIATPLKAAQLYPMVSEAWRQWKSGQALTAGHIAPAFA